MIFGEKISLNKNEFTEINFSAPKLDFSSEVEKARSEGFKKGYEEYAKKLEELINNFKKNNEKFEKEIINIKRDFESKVMETAFLIAEKILKYELNKEGYKKMFLSYVSDNKNKNCKILLSSSDYDKLKSDFKNDEAISKIIEVSQELKEGEVYIKSEEYFKEITVLKQMEILKDNFLGN
jgi:flagellar biosynthesis/type III secretory pathway protein FliH